MWAADGSVDEEGIGYTEKKIRLRASDEEARDCVPARESWDAPADKTETDDAAWKKLQAFRAKVEKKHTCVYWKTAEELKAKVIVAMTSGMKRHPAVGWVRADQVPAGSTLADVLALRNRIAELEAEMKAAAVTPPPGTAYLQQGDDVFPIQVKFDARDPGTFKRTSFTGHFGATWDEIFAAVAPTMINEASEGEVRRAFGRSFSRRATNRFVTRRIFGEKNL